MNVIFVHSQNLFVKFFNRTRHCHIHHFWLFLLLLKTDWQCNNNIYSDSLNCIVYTLCEFDRWKKRKTLHVVECNNPQRSHLCHWQTLYKMELLDWKKVAVVNSEVICCTLQFLYILYTIVLQWKCDSSLMPIRSLCLCLQLHTTHDFQFKFPFASRG